MRRWIDKAGKHLLLPALGFAIIFWVCDIFVDVLLFKEGTIGGHFLNPLPLEIYYRIFVTLIFISFAFVGQRMVQRRRRAEEQLRQTENKYKIVAENTYDWEFWTGADGKFIYTSPASLRVTGYSPQRFNESPDFLDSIIHPEDVGLYARHRKEAELEHGLHEVEFRVIHANGAIRWISHACQPVFGPKGEFWGIRGTNRDITARKSIELELESNEKKYKELFSSMLNAFALHRIVLDENGKPVDYVFLEVNSAFERMTGLKRKDILGRPVTEAIPGLKEDAFDWIGAYGKVALNNDKIQFEQYSQALGKWFSITAYSPVREMFATIFEDITERKKVEGVIWENQERMDVIFNSIEAGIIVVDKETHIITYVNQKAASMIGAPPDEIMDRSCHNFICPAEAGACPITDLGQQVDNSEKCVLTAAGGKIPILKTVVEDELGGRAVLVESFVDITERKKFEEELRFKNVIMSTQQEASIDGILVVGEDNSIVSCNSRFVEMWGIPPELVAKKDDAPVLELVTGQVADSRAFLERVQYLYDSRQEVSRDEVVLKDGRVFDRYSSPMMGPDEQYYGRVWYFRDISERKRGEDKLRQLSVAVEQSPSIIVITDRQGNIEYVNPAFVQATGYEADEVLGKNPRILKSGEMPDKEYKKLWDIITTGKQWRGEFHNKKKNGELYWEQATIGPIKKADGGFDRFIAVKEVITERKEAQVKEKALFRISQAASTSQSLDQLYSSIHQILGDLLNVNNFYIAIYNSSADMLEFPYFVDEQDPKPLPRRLRKGLTEYILKTGSTLLASPDKQKELVAAGEVEMVGTPSLDWLGVPLKMKGTTSGALVIQTYDPAIRFNLREKEILEFVSDHVATAIERAQAREDLTESEEKYRELIENQGEGVAVADMNDVFTFVNPAAEDIFGVPRGGLAGKSLMNFLSPQQTGVVKSQNNLRVQGEKSSYELTITRPDGTLRTILITASPQYHKGRMDGTFGVFRDISDLKAAEEELRASEAINRTMVESAGRAGEAIVLMQDTSSVKLACIVANQEAVRITGYSQEELKHKAWLDLVHPDYLEQTGKRAQARLEGQDISEMFEISLISKYGNKIPIEITGSQVRYQGKLALVGFFREITERKKAEAEMQRLRQQIEFILGSTKTGLDIIDSHYNIRYVDPEWQKVYGDFKGRKCYEYFMGRQDPCPGCGIAQGLENKGTIVTEEILVKENNRPIQVTTIPFQDANGEWMVAEVNVDITERKKAEAEREKLITELQDALNRIKTLKGLIPICASCKKIRNDGGYWQQVEEYVSEHTEADFSHGLCDECAQKLYPEIFLKKKKPEEGGA
jgi:PAS domain S-box-containing protein